MAFESVAVTDDLEVRILLRRIEAASVSERRSYMMNSCEIYVRFIPFEDVFHFIMTIISLRDFGVHD